MNSRERLNTASSCDSDEWVGKKYRQSVGVQPLIELALGLYFTATVFYALVNQIYATLPFLMLFQIGFLYTGLLSILQQYHRRERHAQDAGSREVAAEEMLNAEC